LRSNDVSAEALRRHDLSAEALRRHGHVAYAYAKSFSIDTTGRVLRGSLSITQSLFTPITALFYI
jgi:hypothetical protein